MTNIKIDLRYSDTDFATFLLIKGFTMTYIEVVQDKKHNKLKAFTHFEEDKNELINLQKEYEKGNILVNPKEFSKVRKELNLKIKNELNNYRQSN